MTHELHEAKQALGETFHRMRLIESRHAKEILSLREGRPIETMRQVRERAEARAKGEQ